MKTVVRFKRGKATVYQSMTQAAQENEYRISNIVDFIKTGRVDRNGYHWRYVTDTGGCAVNGVCDSCIYEECVATQRQMLEFNIRDGMYHPRPKEGHGREVSHGGSNVVRVKKGRGYRLGEWQDNR